MGSIPAKQTAAAEYSFETHGRSKTRLPDTERSYQQFWRSRNIHPGRIVGVTLMAGLAWLGFSTFFGWLALALDPRTVERGSGGVIQLATTPALYLMNNLSLAMLIPIVMIASAALLGQPAGYLASVVGRMRWRWLFKCALVLLPIWLVQQSVELFLVGGTEGLGVNSDTWVMIAIILGTQVFQCAGEEYGFRGLLNRMGGSLVESELAGFLTGGIISSGFFMLVHGAGDVWLNIFYFSFGMCAAWLTWRTGGLEAAIAMHCVNNLLALSLLPFSDLSEIFNRESGVGSPWMLINIAVMIGATALITWLGRKEGLTRRTAPGAPFEAPALADWPAPQLPDAVTSAQPDRPLDGQQPDQLPPRQV